MCKDLHTTWRIEINVGNSRPSRMRSEWPRPYPRCDSEVRHADWRWPGFVWSQDYPDGMRKPAEDECLEVPRAGRSISSWRGANAAPGSRQWACGNAEERVDGAIRRSGPDGQSPEPSHLGHRH